MRIVVVEDETKTRKGIEKLCKELGEEYVVAGTAKNGKEGLELIRRVQPDIVLTDIMMPQLNGLEMIEALLGGESRCKFIILSGYAEFHYAQEAIKLGSVDYLLKPITRESLISALHHVKDLLEKEAKVIDPKRYSNAQLLSVLVDTHGNHGPELQKEMEIRFVRKETAGLAVVRSDVRIRAADQLLLQKLLQQESKGIQTAGCFSENKREYILFIAADEKEEAKRLLETVKKRAEEAIPCELVFSYAELQDGEDFYTVLEQVRELSNWHLVLNGDEILDQALIRSLACEKFHYPTNTERKLVESIYAGRMEDIKLELDAFMNCLRERQYDYKAVKEAVICMTVAVLYAIRQSSYGIYDEINHLNILDWLKDKIILSSVRNMLLNMIGELEHYQNSVRSASHPLVKKALKIIECDFKRDISVEEIAGLLHITPEYLGSLFTRELGIKFTVYCTQKRIGYARELFGSKALKVYEVAEACGYSDVKYFCKVFKKYTGKSPSDYQHSFHG